MKTLILSIAVLLLTGCGTSKFIKTGFNDDNKLPPLPEGTEVAVITELPVDAVKIIEIGICRGSVPGGGAFADYTHKAINRIKKCALENGGNTILLDTKDVGGVYSGFGLVQESAKAQGRIFYIEF